MVAAYFGHLPTFELLLQRHARCDPADPPGAMAYHIAYSRGFAGVSNCFDVHVSPQKSIDSKSRTAADKNLSFLHLATEGGHTEVINSLFCNDIEKDINRVVGANKETALHCAAAFGHTDAAALLLESGADASLCTASGALPLHIAAENGYLGVATAIIHVRPDLINYASSENGATALLCASQGGHADVVTYLLEKGADPAHMTAGGLRTEIVALANGHKCIATILAKTSGMKGKFAPITI
jgi:ankyrin repeat protein